MIEDEIARLPVKFSKAVFLSNEEYEGAFECWSRCLIGKFLDSGISYDFAWKELKLDGSW